MDSWITQRSTDFIARNAAAGTHFFLYANFTTVHPPVSVHPDFKGSSGSSEIVPDNLVELDHRAGQILDALDAAGVADDTIVVWSSDNAAGDTIRRAGGPSGPWRGSFGQTWEGSIRAPAMVRWPGNIPQGQVSQEIIAATDWFPRLAAMAGAGDRVPTDRPINDFDISAHLFGQSEQSRRDNFILYGTDGDLLSAKWKTTKVHFRKAMEGSLCARTLDPKSPQFMTWWPIRKRNTTSQRPVSATGGP